MAYFLQSQIFHLVIAIIGKEYQRYGMFLEVIFTSTAKKKEGRKGGRKEGGRKEGRKINLKTFIKVSI